LKKKNQKTFLLYVQQPFSQLNASPRAIDKSFLLLFFKKEVLPLPFPASAIACRADAYPASPMVD
jgi:hypothetical protein